MAGFTPSPGLEQRLLNTAEMQAARERTAQRLAETAQSIAPVGAPDEPDEHPGRFRDGIHAEGSHVVSDDPASVPIIFGSENNPPFDTLRRAAEMNGLHVTH